METKRRSTRKRPASSPAPTESSRLRKKALIKTPAIIDTPDDEDPEEDELEMTPLKSNPSVAPKGPGKGKAKSVRFSIS